MTTLGTASILITADDRQLQQVLARIPNQLSRVVSQVQSQSVSAFGSAGAAAGRAYVESLQAAYRSISASAPPAQRSAPQSPTTIQPAQNIANTFAAAGQASGQAFASGIAAGANNIGASITNPIVSVTRPYAAAGVASGRSFATGVRAQTPGINSTIATPIQSIAQQFSTAGIASGNAFGIGVRSGTVGIGAGIATQLASTTTGATSAGERAGRAFAAGFGATARAVAAPVTGIFNTGRNIGQNARQSIGAGVSNQIGATITQSAFGAAGALVDSKNITAFDAASRKVAQLTKDQKGMEKAAQSLSKELRFGVNSTEVLVAGYETLSSGFQKTTDVANILRPAIKATIASQGEARLDKVNDAITSVINSYKAWGYSADSADKIVNQISGTVDAGKIKYGQYAQQIGKAASVAASAGISFEELNTAIAKATISGQLPESVLSGIPGIITNISKPTKAAVKTAAELGIEFDAGALKAKGLLGVMASISTATEKLGGAKRSEVIQNLFGSVRGKNIATALINDPKGTQEIKAQIEKGSIDKNFNLATGGIKFKQEALKNRVIELDVKLKQGAFGNALAAGLGIASKAIEGLISGVEKLNKVYSSLSPQQRALVDNLGGVAIAATATVAGIAAIGFAVGVIGAPLAKTAILLGGLAIKLGAVAFAAAPIAIPIIAASAAVYGLAKAMGATDADAFKAAMGAAGVSIAAVFGPAAIAGVVAGATAITTGLSAIAVAAWAAAAPFAPFVLAIAAVVAAGAILYKVFTNPAIKKWAIETGDAIGKWANSVLRWFKQASDGIKSQLDKWSPWLRSVGGSFNGLGGVIVEAFKLALQAGDALGKGLSLIFSDLGGSIGRTIDSIKQLPAELAKALDAFNVFKDRSKDINIPSTNQRSAVSTPSTLGSPAGLIPLVEGAGRFLGGKIREAMGGGKNPGNPNGSTNPRINGSPNYGPDANGKPISFKTSSTTFDPSQQGALVASLDLSGLGLNFTNSVTNAGSEFNSAIGKSVAQLNRVFNVSSPIANIRSANEAANFEPPLEIQKPYAHRDRGGREGNKHLALDYPGKPGTPVLAAFDGEAEYEKVSYKTKKGTRTTGAVTLTGLDAYGNKIAFRYFHLGVEAAAKIGTKEFVKAGQEIGKISTDGRQGGNTPHLDLKGYINGTKVADPRNILRELLRQQSELARGTTQESTPRVETTTIARSTPRLPVETTPKPAPTPAAKVAPPQTTKAVPTQPAPKTPTKPAQTQPAPKPPVILKPQFIEPIVKTDAPDNSIVTTKAEPNNVEVNVNVQTDTEPVVIPPPPSRPLFGGIVGTPLTTSIPEPPVLPDYVKGGTQDVNVVSAPPPPPPPEAARLSQVPTPPAPPPPAIKQSAPVRQEPIVRPPVQTVAPINAPAAVSVGASTYYPGKSNTKYEGPEKDVKGNRLTVNDKVVAIPGLANGGIKDVVPYGTIVVVTNPKTGLSTEAAVKDAGPFAGKQNRQLDVTEAVAKAINFSGTGQLEIKIVKLPSGYDPNKVYQIGDTKKFGSTKKSNIIPGPSIAGPGLANTQRLPEQIGTTTTAIASETASNNTIEDAQTRLNRAIADIEQIEREGVRQATGKKGTNRGVVQARYNNTYARKLENARRRKEDAQKALDRAQVKSVASEPAADVDRLRSQFDAIVSEVTVENAKTDKALSGNQITQEQADRAKATRSQTQFNRALPILQKIPALKEKYANTPDIKAQLEQLEASIFEIGKGANEAKTRVSSQTIEALKDRIATIFSDFTKQEESIANDLKSGKITAKNAAELDTANKVQQGKELVAQEGSVRSLKSISTNKSDINAFDDILGQIAKARADAIAALKTEVNDNYKNNITLQIEIGEKRIEDVALSRKVGAITSAEEEQKALDIRINTNNQLQKTIKDLLYLRSISENSDEVKSIDEQIRRVNEFYANTVEARKNYYVDLYKSREENVLKVRDQRTTEVNQAAEANPDRTNREVEQQERTLLVIRQQSSTELGKLVEEIKVYRDSLNDADIKTREALNEQIARITSTRLEVAKAMAEADKNAVLLRETTKSIGSAGQEAFKSMFLDASNGFRSIGSIVDNLINKVADIGLNAIFDSLINNNKGGGGIFGDILGFLGFNAGGTVPNLGNAGAGAVSIANYATGGPVGVNKAIGKAFGIVGGLQAALKREGAGGVPIVAKEGEEVLSIPNARLYRSLAASGEWERIKKVNNYAVGGSIGQISTPTVSSAPTMQSSGSSNTNSNIPTRGTITVDRINGVDYVTVEQMAAFVDIKMPQAAQAGAALSERNLANTNYRQRNGLTNR